MTTINISLPDAMLDWVQSRIESGNYANASDYVLDLIRHDRDRAQSSLDASIARGLADADAGRVHALDEVCDELDAKYARMAQARGAGPRG